MQLEDPAPLSKVLGRGHIKHDGGLALHPADFARQCVKLFEELSGKPVKLVRAPHVDEGSLVATDQVDRGQLSNVAAKLVINDDKRMTRLADLPAMLPQLWTTVISCVFLTSRLTCDCQYTLMPILAVHPI